MHHCTYIMHSVIITEDDQGYVMHREQGCNITQSQAFTGDPTVSGLSHACTPYSSDHHDNSNYYV